MKNITRTSFFILLLSAGLASCTQSSSTNTKKTTSSSTSNGSTSGTDNGTSGTISGCDGLYRANASSCYYTNLPRVVMSGPGSYGTTWWTSSALPNYISPNQFRTDATFSVRIKPSAPIGNETSRQGRICSPYTVVFSKLKVQVMLRRDGDSLGEIKELTANINSYSNTARFTVPGGTDKPYIMEVLGVTSDHRCKIGSLTADMTTACNAGTYFADIPINSVAPAPTYCVAFNLEMATDSTYDLPN